MEDQPNLFTLRDFTIEIAFSDTTESLLKYATIDEQNQEYLDMTEEEMVKNLQADVFRNIERYVHSFGNLPENGTFMANDMNIPIFIISKFLDGLEGHMAIICHINEEQQDNRPYAFRHQN